MMSSIRQSEHSSVVEGYDRASMVLFESNQKKLELSSSDLTFYLALIDW